MTLPSRGHFSSPLVSSVGMKGRALFLPDISLTACRYLSVLIRAVAGLVWLLPGCESNHTSSFPPSLIYGWKNSLACLRKFERGRAEKGDGIEKSAFPALSLLSANTLHKIKYSSIKARRWWQTICFLSWKSSKGAVILWVQKEWWVVCRGFKNLRKATHYLATWNFPLDSEWNEERLFSRTTLLIKTCIYLNEKLAYNTHITYISKVLKIRYRLLSNQNKMSKKWPVILIIFLSTYVLFSYV